MSALSPLTGVSNDTCRVLHVDDDPDFAEMTAAFLEREREAFDVETATSAAAGLEALAADSFDCVVSDYEMPGRNGIEFLEAVRESHPELPFILFTGKGSEEVASDAISAGVTEYLQKGGGTDQYAVLANRIANAVEHDRARQAIERGERRLRDIVDAVPHLLYVVDREGRYILANETLASFHDTTANDIEGSSVDDVLGEAEAARFRKRIGSVLDSGEARRFPEVEVEGPDGESHLFEPRLLPYDLDDDTRAVLGIATEVTERIERERELERYEAYLEESTDVVTVLAEDGTISYESPSVSRVLGHEPGSLMGRDGFEYVHPDDVEETRAAFRELAANPEGTTTIECRFRTADGEWRWLEIHGTNQLSNPAIDGIVTNNRDITDRKEREQELERASDLLDRTERIADVGGWEIDPDTEELFWTNNLFELLGIDAEETPPLGEALDVFHETDRPLVGDAVTAALEDGEPFDVEARFYGPEDEVRWLRVQGVPTVEDGEVTTLRGAVQDVTEQKERERDLEQARTEYAELINGMNDTAWVIDDDCTFLAVNDAAVETLGYTRGEFLSMRPHDIDARHEPEEITALIDSMPEDEHQVFETVHRTKDGEEVPVEISSSLITYRGETAILSIGRDISDRKEREKQLEQFASVVSHDLRNPLNVAQGRLELVEADDPNLEHVERAHDRMVELIDDLLVLARQGDSLGVRESIVLDSLVRGCWENVATRGATLRVETERSVLADRNRLQQLFENLFRNAVEHGSTGNRTQSGDAVEHGSTGSRAQSNEPADGTAPTVEELTITVGDLDDSTGFYVADDGVGIDDAEREELFSPGYSTSDAGTGFGLSIVKQIADAHGWTVEVTASESGGARFEFRGVERPS